MRAKLVIFIMATAIAVATPAPARDIHIYGGRSAATPFIRNGVELLKKGDEAGARRNFDDAIRADPRMWPGYYNRARLFMQQHQWTLAVEDLNAALRLKPTFYRSAIMRAMANQQLGNYRVSLDEVNRVISRAPDTQEFWLALCQRAWLKAVCPDASFRNGKQAVADAKRACELTHWKEFEYVDTLAAAYAEAGEFDAAIRYQEQALTLVPAKSKNSEGAVKARQHLALFKQHRPVREPSA